MGSHDKEIDINNTTIYIRQFNYNAKEHGCKYYLEKENGEVLTPQVKSITYDKRNNAFLIQDKISITEYTSCAIYYYVDTEGNIISLAFTDLLDGLFPLPFQTKKEFVYQYEAFKYHLSSEIRQKLNLKEQVNLDNCEKFIRVKRKDQNEDKVYTGKK